MKQFKHYNSSWRLVMEKKPEEYIKGPLHIVRCIGELAVMYCQEKKRERDGKRKLPPQK